jgi:RNA polymerase sigma-70 factor (ECF subfamily)
MRAGRAGSAVGVPSSRDLCNEPSTCRKRAFLSRLRGHPPLNQGEVRRANAVDLDRRSAAAPAGGPAMRSSASRLRLVTPPEVAPDVAPQDASAAPLPWSEPSLETLYERYAVYVGALASRILGRAAEVDDVVQDVFASAVRGLRRKDDEREIKGWFAKVTVRRCVRQLRMRRIWAVAQLAAAPSYDRLPAPGASPDERQLIIEVYRALDRLPARQRIAWTLHHVEGETLPQVAALCGCSLATVKRHIAQARAKLMRQLRERGDA